MNADEFYDYLVGIVKPNTPDVLSWTSESDCPVEVVELPWWKLWYTPSKMAWNRFAIQSFANTDNSSQYLRWRELYLDQSRFDWREMKRPGKSPSEYNLYLAVRFGAHWVGLRCKIIET